MNNVNRLANRTIKCVQGIHGSVVIYRHRRHHPAFTITRKQIRMGDTVAAMAHCVSLNNRRAIFIQQPGFRLSIYLRLQMRTGNIGPAIGCFRRIDPRRLLTHKATIGQHQTISLSILAQGFDHRGNPMGRIIIPRATKKRQPTGHTHLVMQGVKPKHLSRKVHNNRETAVNITVSNSPSSNTRTVDSASNSKLQRPRLRQIRAFRHQLFFNIRVAMQIDPFIRFNTQLFSIADTHQH